MDDANGGARCGVSDHAEDLVIRIGMARFLPAREWTRTAVDADGNLATASQSGEGCAFDGDGEAGGRVIEESNCGQCGLVAFAGLDAERTLAGRGAEILRGKAFADPVGFLETIEAGGGEEDGIDLAFGEFAQASIDVAAKFNRINVGAKSA